MTAILSLATVTLPLLYLVVFGTYVWLFREDHPVPRRICSRLAAITVLLHVAALVVRGLSLQRLPLGNPLEFASALAAALMATYLIIELRWRTKQTGFVVAGLAFILQFLASSFGTLETDAGPLLRDPGYAGHVVFVLLAYTALTLSFIYASLYLVQARQLMRRQFGLSFRRLPALDILERMSIGAVEMGVPLLFVALCLGQLWMYDLADRVDPQLAARLSPWDPKVLISWAIFLAYGGGLIGHRWLGWRGRRMNLAAIAAYVAVVAAMGLVHHLVPSFHDFTSLPVGLAGVTGLVLGCCGRSV